MAADRPGSQDSGDGGDEDVRRLSYVDAPPVDSQAAWDAFNEWLPEMLERLLDSPAYDESNPPPAGRRGIYLFSEGERALYIGRTSITARSRSAGKEPSTSFLARWKQHTSPHSRPNAASFASKLAHEVAVAFDLEEPSALKASRGLTRTDQWWTLRDDDPPPDYYAAFQEAKRFIRQELEFRVVELEDDVRGVRSHVAEVYADVVLQAAYGDFSTS